MLTALAIKKQVEKGINNFQGRSHLFNQFYRKALETGELFLVGGAIRDFALENNPRDLDFIIDCSNNELIDLIKEVSYRKNRFGGYKLKFNEIEIDIWSLSNHWAFKKELYESSFENISKGAFFNYDAITMDLSNFELDADIFLESYEDKLLDVNLKDEYAKLNPTPEKNVKRAMKLKQELGFEFSQRLKEYCDYWTNSNDIKYLI